MEGLVAGVGDRCGKQTVEEPVLRFDGVVLLLGLAGGSAETQVVAAFGDAVEGVRGEDGAGFEVFECGAVVGDAVLAHADDAPDQVGVEGETEGRELVTPPSTCRSWKGRSRRGAVPRGGRVR